jgi:hypothetical protein
MTCSRSSMAVRRNLATEAKTKLRLIYEGRRQDSGGEAERVCSAVSRVRASCVVCEGGWGFGSVGLLWV